MLDVIMTYLLWKDFEIQRLLKAKIRLFLNYNGFCMFSVYVLNKFYFREHFDFPQTQVILRVHLCSDLCGRWQRRELREYTMFQ